ncbi:hypothetical protein H4R20_005975 [Coemansia guatemalensis]|uniref:Uncharacterized protein n=1 Tax=Coemansia guatemalensis TaxID=2761395 RepID=A0A9W8HNT4_9FUNG|nr:hypothetical protein H4R20_005975 [Coemansia guatemalensis]
MYPTPPPFPAHAASQPSVAGGWHDVPRPGNDAFAYSLPAAIPLPGALDIGPPLPQTKPDAYGFHNPSTRRRHGQVPSYPPAAAPDSCCSCCYNPGNFPASAAHQNHHHHHQHRSASPPPPPPLDGVPCACCPPQPGYGRAGPYPEAPQMNMGGAVPMSMPAPMPMPHHYHSASVPAYHKVPMKPRKRVTFADPIAEYKMLPCESSSAPEHSEVELARVPTRRHGSGRERRNSIMAFPDSNHSISGEHSIYSNQGLASGLDMLVGSFPMQPPLPPHAGGGHKKRLSASAITASTTSLEYEPRRPSASRKHHERRRSDGAHPTFSYNEKFSLSRAHLPING